MRRAVVILLSLAVIAGGCNCNDDEIGLSGHNEVAIESPEDGAHLFIDEKITFRATGKNDGGLVYLSLQIGSQEFKVCDPGETDTQITCEGEFDPKQYASQISTPDNALVLKAVVKDHNDVTAEAAITVYVRPLVVTIVRPKIATGADRALLKGQDPVEIAVKSAVPIEAVEIRLDDTVVRTMRADRTSYKWTDIKWTTLPTGTGDHRLTATARDTNTNVDSAFMDVRVLCGGDGDCATGKRCCVEDGLCHDTVARGAECDCAHPCPTDQGCFPGICGQTPRKCRPGCNPGNDSRYADRCPNQDGQTAYCLSLPASEATAANKGGACALADGCDVVRQNCPDLPLDRTKPASDTENPRVAHTCVPVSPVATACLPAGTIPLGGINCAYDTCGDASDACAKGLICTTPIDENGTPAGPSSCNKQCKTPVFSVWDIAQAPDCPRGQYCSGLYGVGLEKISTGICEDMPF